MNQRDAGFLNRIFQNVPADEVCAVVVNQCTEVEPLELESSFPNVKILSVSDRGLSKSRNLALKNSSADICVVCDDDVVYKADVLKTISETFLKTQADVVRFQIETPEGSPYKVYPDDVKVNTLRDAMGVSSIEIAFKKSAIISSGIDFDENFGLGGLFSGSEDMIFISDCIQKGLFVESWPIKFVIHPKESSGTDLSAENYRLIETRGAAFTRIFGSSRSLIVLVAYAFKRYKSYKVTFSIMTFLNFLLAGRSQFLKLRSE